MDDKLKDVVIYISVVLGILGIYLAIVFFCLAYAELDKAKQLGLRKQEVCGME